MDNKIATFIRNDERTQKGIMSAFKFFLFFATYFIIHSLTIKTFWGYTYLLLIIFPLVGFLTALVLNRMDLNGEKIGFITSFVVSLTSFIPSTAIYLGVCIYLANMFQYTEELHTLSLSLSIVFGLCIQKATTQYYISAYNTAIEEFNFFDYIAEGSEDKVYEANKKIDLLLEKDIEVDPYNIISDLASLNKKLNQETAFYFSTTLTNYIPNLLEALDLVAKAQKESDRNIAISLSKDIIARIEEDINFYEDTESQVTETLKEKELEQEEDSFEERITLIKKSLD